MYYVYILRCLGDTLYTGGTTDLRRRLRQHLGLIRGGAKYTASHPPQALAMAWSAPDRVTAQRLEAAIKQLSRAEKEQLIAQPADLLGGLCPRLDTELYTPLPEDERAASWPHSSLDGRKE